MNVEIAKNWVKRYQSEDLSSKEDLREAGIAYLVLGEVMKASEIYEQELIENISVERVIDAAISNEEQKFYSSSLNCYRLAVDNLNIDDRGFVARIFEGLKRLKEINLNCNDIDFLENRLLDMYR
jgi:hypothetical protein